ncbi:MAG TPA: archaetidylserine decarboxylase [Nevskiaceae bacterium]|nr:archaetidylserine decarboxylase [Nevskiaceae bacterium]
MIEPSVASARVLPAGNDWRAWSFAAAQRGLPTRALSRVVHRVTQSRAPAVKRQLIASFMHSFGVDLSDAVREDPQAYVSFNDFFTRELKPGARPLAGSENTFSSPVDGTVSQRGAIHSGRIVQAKGRDYSVAELLTDPAAAERLEGGSFCTIYLAPFNYHRIHMPCAGHLIAWTYVPGRLFSVNPGTARNIPRLFARNERLVAHFDTTFGRLALVMVGALFVGSLETAWAGVVSPPHRRLGGPHHHRLDTGPHYVRGEEIGRFNMGSTVILLTPRDALGWDPSTVPGRVLRMGCALAQRGGANA